MSRAARAKPAAARAAAPSPRTDDREFWRAEQTVSRWLTWRADVEGANGQAQPTSDEVEAAAEVLAAFHRRHGDAASLAFVVARCRDFHVLGQQLPMALQGLMIELAAATAPARRRGNQPADLAEREIWRTHAALMQHHVNRGCSIEEAAELVNEFKATPGPKSISTLINHYEWARREAAKRVKATKDE